MSSYTNNTTGSPYSPYRGQPSTGSNFTPVQARHDAVISDRITQLNTSSMRNLLFSPTYSMPTSNNTMSQYGRSYTASANAPLLSNMPSPSTFNFASTPVNSQVEHPSNHLTPKTPGVTFSKPFIDKLNSDAISLGYTSWAEFSKSEHHDKIVREVQETQKGKVVLNNTLDRASRSLGYSSWNEFDKVRQIAKPQSYDTLLLSPQSYNLHFSPPTPHLKTPHRNHIGTLLTPSNVCEGLKLAYSNGANAGTITKVYNNYTTGLQMVIHSENGKCITVPVSGLNANLPTYYILDK